MDKKVIEGLKEVASSMNLLGWYCFFILLFYGKIANWISDPPPSSIDAIEYYCSILVAIFWSLNVIITGFIRGYKKEP